MGHHNLELKIWRRVNEQHESNKNKGQIQVLDKINCMYMYVIFLNLCFKLNFVADYFNSIKNADWNNCRTQSMVLQT